MGDTTKTMVDLDLRCWQKIGIHLRLKDILNIAEVFNITTQNKKQLENNNHNQDQKLIQFNRFTKNIQKIFIDMTGGEWYIDSEDCVPFAIKLLRHFGYAISSLSIDYGDISDEMCTAIDDAILNNCNEFLKKLALSDMHENTFSNICQPFQNVKRVHFYGGVLGKRLSKFHRWFPKLHELDFEEVSFEKPDCVEHHFPHLTVLGISNGQEADISCITDSNIKVILQLNPQLRHLNLCDDAGGRDDFGIGLNQQFLFFVQRKLLNLSHLNLTISHFDYETIYHNGILTFEYLTTLTLNVKKWSYLSKILIASKRLEKLTLESDESCECVGNNQNYEIISNFIKKNYNINYLFIKSIHIDYDLYSKYTTDLVNGLWNLDDFNLEYDWQGAMAADAIINFLFKCKQLVKFTAHWNVDGLNKPGAKLKQQFIDSFNSCAEINMFDTTGWDISFGYYWNSTNVSFSKQS